MAKTLKTGRRKHANADEMRERLEYAREMVAKWFRRSDCVREVMEKFSISRESALDLVIRAEDAIAAEFGEGETERIRGKIAQVFEKIIHNPDGNERVKKEAAAALAKLIGANRPKTIRVESQTDEALDALIREQLKQLEQEK